MILEQSRDRMISLPLHIEGDFDRLNRPFSYRRWKTGTILFVMLSLASFIAVSLSSAGCGTFYPTDDFGNGNGYGSNIGFGGEQDFAYFRLLLEENRVPEPGILTASGFFAEHHTQLPSPDCGSTLCLHTMLGVDQDFLGGGEPRTILQIALNTQVEIKAEDRPDLDITLSIDVSGSMRGENRMGFVISGLLMMLDEMADDDRLALITYDSEAELVMPMVRVGDAREVIQGHIESLTPRGMTALYAGLEMAYQEAVNNYDPDRQARVVMLSDGQANVGPTSSQEIMDMSRGYNLEGIGLTTIGLGNDFNVELMRGLAEQGDGNFYFVATAGDVQDVFTVEVHSFTVPVAKDVKIEVNEGYMYTFSNSWGSPHWEDNETGGTLEIPSVFAAFRRAHDDTTETGGRRGGGSALLLQLNPREDIPENVSDSDVAVVRLSYYDSELDEYVEKEVEVNYPFHPKHVMQGGYFSSDGEDVIMKSYAMLHAFLALEKACELYWNQSAQEAVDLLVSVKVPLSALENLLNDGEGDEDIQRDIDIIKQLEAVIQSNMNISE